MQNKKRLFAVFLFLALSLLLLLAGTAKSKHSNGSIRLLAVTQGKETKGSVANLVLEIHPGKGRIFIDSFPLTKLDTQLSTRLANKIACTMTEKRCSDYDFFYTIRADSVIIGGPSAGAAIAALTIAVLNSLEINSSVAITGTINPGAIIGTVGGLKEKIKAASEHNITKVIVAIGSAKLADIKIGNKTTENKSGQKENRSKATANSTKITNSTKISFQEEDLISYGRKLGVEIVEAGTLDDALEAIIKGNSYKAKARKGNISKNVDASYKQTMKKIAGKLCNRTRAMLPQKSSLKNRSLYKKAINLSGKADAAFKKESYYSAASFCFGANIALRELLLRESTIYSNISLEKQADKAAIIENNAERQLKRMLNSTKAKKTESIIDLETRNIVIERLIDAKDSLEKAKTRIKKARESLCISGHNKKANTTKTDIAIEEASEEKGIIKESIEKANSTKEKRRLNSSNKTKGYEKTKAAVAKEECKEDKIKAAKELSDAYYSLAYGIERINSAKSWSMFFGKGSKEAIIDNATLHNSCISKLAEAEERLQYALLIVPFRLEDTRKELNRAYADEKSGNYGLCLFKATKAKAEADLIISAAGISERNIDKFLSLKLSVVSSELIKKQEKGLFSILGYSYYEYAKELSKTDKFSALLYAEYSLELGNLELYFPKKETTASFIWLAYTKEALLFLAGSFFGCSLAIYVITKKNKKRIKLKNGKKRKL